jgi:signal transduction histidine kinase
MKARSLNARLALVIAWVIGLSWLTVVGAVLTQFSLNQTSTSDKELAAVATQLLATIPASASLDGGPAPGSGLEPRAASRSDLELVVFQIWIDHRKLFAATPGAPRLALKSDFADGLASSLVEGRKWRVYSITDKSGRVTVQAATPQHRVDRDMRDLAEHVLVLATALLLIAGMVMWFVTRRAFKPVHALSTALRERHGFDLAPLPLAGLPRELHPFVASFNKLLGRLEDAVEGERRFIGDAAHELRTPLSAVQAQAEIALNAGSPREQEAALNKLLVVARRSTRLAEQLLDLARINAGANAPRRATADLSKLAEHVAQEFEVYASQNRRSLYMDVRPCLILCDTDEIGILLRNLVHNALRYTSQGGNVLVRCGYRTGKPDGPAPAVFLEVADDGPGVAASEREAIFQRFHRVAGTAVRGSGIGLSLVASIAGSHGAVIEVDTGLEGRGLLVRVVFPVVGVPADPLVAGE